jgi:hypothetical protein
VVDVVLIAAGAALTAFTAGAGIVVGKSLMGAGTSGLMYDVQAAFNSNQDITTYNIGWGLNLAVGAIGGASEVGQTQLASFAAKKVASKAISKAVSLSAQVAYGAATGVVNNVAQQLVNNYVSGESADSGLLFAAVQGVALGGCMSLSHTNKPMPI